MWKVLLVEDELFVRESIKETIRWEELGFTVIGEAGDGEEALNMIRHHRPDLVITDIIMPKMDGLELLRQAKRINTQCKFIMLSAMGDFEYVQQALEEGASSYILKLSMSVQSLRDALQKISVELSAVKEEPLLMLSNVYDRAWKTLYQNMLNGLPENGIENVVIPRGYANMSLTICCALNVPTQFTLHDFEYAMGCGTNMEKVIHTHIESGVTTFFIWTPSPLPISQITIKLPFPYAINNSKDSSQMLDTWQLCLRTLDAVWYGEQSGTLSNVKWSIEQTESVFPWNKIRTLISSFEQHDLHKCIELLENFWDGMAKVSTPMIFVKKKAQEILEIYEKIVNDPSVLDMNIDRIATHEEMKQEIRNKTEECLTRHIKKTIKLSDHPEVNKIIVYIEQNYSQDITVKWLAKYIAMDENYISSLFKHKMEIPLIQYLHKVRVEKSLYYLTETDLSISKIGEKVGFNNDNYFIKIFKRWYKHTPSYYRKIHRARKSSLLQSI